MKFKFLHNNINVRDLARSLAFYEKALGLKEVSRVEMPDFTLVYLGDGGSTPHELELTHLKDRETPYNLGDNEFHLAFGVDAVNALVVQHAAIVLEEGPVAARDVAQHGRETVVARTVSAVFAFGPHRRHGTAGIAVTTTASVSRVDGTETVGRRTRVVIEAVALLEAACQLARHPRRTLVVSQ